MCVVCEDGRKVSSVVCIGQTKGIVCGVYGQTKGIVCGMYIQTNVSSVCVLCVRTDEGIVCGEWDRRRYRLWCMGQTNVSSYGQFSCHSMANFYIVL